MTWLKNLVYKLVGKKIATETGTVDGISKTKITAVIAVILAAIPVLSSAWGHPITIPDWIYKILGAAGLWTVRDAIQP